MGAVQIAGRGSSVRRAAACEAGLLATDGTLMEHGNESMFRSCSIRGWAVRTQLSSLIRLSGHYTTTLNYCQRSSVFFARPSPQVRSPQRFRRPGTLCAAKRGMPRSLWFAAVSPYWRTSWGKSASAWQRPGAQIQASAVGMSLVSPCPTPPQCVRQRVDLAVLGGCGRSSCKKNGWPLAGTRGHGRRVQVRAPPFAGSSARPSNRDAARR